MSRSTNCVWQSRQHEYGKTDGRKGDCLKKNYKSTYKVSDKAKELERRNRYQAAFRKDRLFPDRDSYEELSGFKSTSWAWHPFYYTPVYFHYEEDVPSESFMHYRNYVESIAKSGTSILKIRGIRQYIRNLQPHALLRELELSNQVTSEVLQGVKCIAKMYLKRLESFKNCLFGDNEKYGTYHYVDWLADNTIKLSHDQLLQRIFYSGPYINRSMNRTSLKIS